MKKIICIFLCFVFLLSGCNQQNAGNQQGDAKNGQETSPASEEPVSEDLAKSGDAENVENGDGEHTANEGKWTVEEIPLPENFLKSEDALVEYMCGFTNITDSPLEIYSLEFETNAYIKYTLLENGKWDREVLTTGQDEISEYCKIDTDPDTKEGENKTLNIIKRGMDENLYALVKTSPWEKTEDGKYVSGPRDRKDTLVNLGKNFDKLEELNVKDVSRMSEGEMAGELILDFFVLKDGDVFLTYFDDFGKLLSPATGEEIMTYDSLYHPHQIGVGEYDIYSVDFLTNKMLVREAASGKNVAKLDVPYLSEQDEWKIVSNAYGVYMASKYGIAKTSDIETEELQIVLSSDIYKEFADIKTMEGFAVTKENEFLILYRNYSGVTRFYKDHVLIRLKME